MFYQTKIYQAFHFLFFATLCYSEDNLALNKDTKMIRNALKSVDGDYKSGDYLSIGKSELVLDLEAAHIIKKGSFNFAFKCTTVNKHFSYSILLNKEISNRDPGFACITKNLLTYAKDIEANHKFTCDSMEAFQFVVLQAKSECDIFITEIQVFDDLSINHALKKDAKIIQKAFKCVDGSFETQDYFRFGINLLVVDLGAAHVIDNVAVIATYTCLLKQIYLHWSLVLKEMKTSADNFTCEMGYSQTHHPQLNISEYINCQSLQAFQFIILQSHVNYVECSMSIEEFQVFGHFSNTSSSIPVKSYSPSIYDMKIDWRCYLAIFLVGVFSSDSLVCSVLHPISFLGTNMIEVVVMKKGRNNIE